MSIINEALKKAQKDRPTLSHPPSQAPGPSVLARNLEVELQQKKNGTNWGPVFILLVLILITGPIVAPLIAVPFKNGGPIASREIAVGRVMTPEARVEYAAAAATAESRRGQFAIEEMAKMPAPPPLYQRPNLILSGVMYTTPSDAYCIINGEVLRVGDSISGARLVSVTPKEVSLEFQGEKIVLPVRGGL